MAARRAGGRNRKRESPATLPGRLRIVAGMWRSRVLEIADVPGLRPTAERIRETLFNWLTPRIASARCLDLFAGTGALGFEALSRGARVVTFVEKSPVAFEALSRNARSLGAANAKLLKTDASAFLQAATPGAFDVIFLDPPFADGGLETLCASIDELGLLAPRGRVYLETDRGNALPVLPPGWRVLREKTAGNVRYALVAPESGNGDSEE